MKSHKDYKTKTYTITKGYKMIIDSALENKKYFSKEEALIRMISLGVRMKMEKGTQYYCYSGGVFFVSDNYDFKKSREWNPNDSSAIPNWINL